MSFGIGKYDHVKIEGIEFKPGEPWFLIRGQDNLAGFAVQAYADLLREFYDEEEAALQIELLADEIEKWQEENPQFVKRPD